MRQSRPQARVAARINRLRVPRYPSIGRQASCARARDVCALGWCRCSVCFSASSLAVALAQGALVRLCALRSIIIDRSIDHVEPLAQVVDWHHCRIGRVQHEPPRVLAGRLQVSLRAPFLRRWRTFGAEWHRNRWSWQTQWRVNEAYAWIGPCTGAQVRLCPAVVRAAAQARRPGLLRDAGHAQPLQHQAHHRHGASSVQRASSTSPHSLASERVCVCVRAALQENERVQYTDLHGLRHSVRVPSGCVWVEGDNKAVSIDSRIYGPLPVNLISGKVLVRVRAAMIAARQRDSAHQMAPTVAGYMAAATSTTDRPDTCQRSTLNILTHSHSHTHDSIAYIIHSIPFHAIRRRRRRASILNTS